MGSADSVASHVFHQPYLAYECCFADSGAERSEIVMQADTFNLAGNAIELETIILGYRDSTDSGFQGLDISHLPTLTVRWELQRTRRRSSARSRR